MKRRAHIAIVFVMLGFLSMPASSAEVSDSVQARVWLKSGSVQDVTILPSRSTDSLRVKLPELTGRVEYAFEDISAVAFLVENAMSKARELYDTGQVAESTELAAKTLMPVLRYLRLKNNVREDVEFMLSAQFQAEQYSQLILAATHLKESWTDPKDIQGLQMISQLSESLKENDPSILKTLEGLPEPPLDSIYYAPYWYGKSLYQEHQLLWRPALESAAHISSLQVRNFAWMPRILYHNARLYWKIRNEEAVDSIRNELDLSYPDNPYTLKTQTLKADFPFPQLKDASFESDPSKDWISSSTHKLQIAKDQDGTLHDNGLLPDGVHALAVTVSPVRPPVTVQQDIHGFQPGETYFLTAYQSARAAEGGDVAGPFLEIRIDDTLIEKRHLVKPVQGKGRYSKPFRRMVTDAFTASQTNHTLSFTVMPGLGSNDVTRTLLLDNVTLRDIEVDRKSYTPEEP